jgi:hypothetical protein
MTDFFTNLVARSFGSAPTLRPRIASLFEPVRGNTVPLTGTVSKPEESFPAMENDVNAGAVRQKDTKEPVARVPENPILKRDNDKSVQENMPVAAQATDVLPMQPLMVHLQRHLQQPLQSVMVSKRESQPSNDSELTLSSLDLPALSATTVSHQDVVHRELQTGRARHIARPDIVSSVETVTGRKNERSLVVCPSIPSELRLTNLALSAKPGRGVRDDVHRPMDVAPPSEPSIQVTIGRIEVRATKESERSTRPAASSPVMSLEEYLGKRSRRGGQ